MAYTPKLAQIGSATLRRLAWTRGNTMSKILEALLGATGRTIAKARPCEACARCLDDSVPSS